MPFSAALALWLTVPAPFIDLLGSDDFGARECASAVLSGWGPAAVPALEGVARGSRDAEVRRRAGDALGAIRARELERKTAAAFDGLCRAGYCAWPWIDSVPPEVARTGDFRERYVRAAAAAGWAVDSADRPAYREATRLYVRQLLADGAAEKDVAELLCKMTREDARRCREEGYRWAGPGSLPPGPR